MKGNAMKKVICLSLVVMALIGCFASCNISQKFSDVLENMSEASPKVNEMINALAEDNVSDAVALMHPDAENVDAAIAQMSNYLSGRKAQSISIDGININTSTGTGGEKREEQLTCKVTLTDGVVVYLNAVYLKDKSGEGFITFQLVLGLI
jgi:hypothetical protein